MKNLTDIRREYNCDSLDKDQLNKNPFKQAELWISQAQDADLKDATAMTLATADKQGQVDARIVLLKGLGEDGFCWYTDYESDKGQQIAENPQGCLLFYWRDFDRQIRIQGRIEELSDAQVDSYFYSRPLDSQFSAAASHQSHPVENRQQLEDKVATLKQANPSAVERPQRWGGYRLHPSQFEFWQGRANRLHDRFRYTSNNDQWNISRLQP